KTEVVIARFDLVDHDFVQVLRPAPGDQTDAVHARVDVPIDAIKLLEPDAAVALSDPANYGQSLFDAFDPLQSFDITRVEVGSVRAQLDGAGSHKDQLRSDVGRASLELVGHSPREPGEEHDESDSQGDARNADKRPNRSLANVRSD